MHKKYSNQLITKSKEHSYNITRAKIKTQPENHFASYQDQSTSVEQDED